MSNRYYLMPLTGAGTRIDPRVPKYRSTDLAGVDVSLMDFGTEPVCLVAADVTTDQHAALVAHPDVMAAPVSLDSQVGANLTTVQAAIESFNIPADWIQSTFTYRTVLRGLAAIAQFLQRFQNFQLASIFQSGITLATRFNQLPPPVQANLRNAATDLGYSTAGLSGTSTIRQILINLGNQFRAVDTIFVGDQTF
jgi:hypothetical protein